MMEKQPVCQNIWAIEQRALADDATDIPQRSYVISEKMAAPPWRRVFFL
jgi:hypothetical protein